MALQQMRAHHYQEAAYHCPARRATGNDYSHKGGGVKLDTEAKESLKDLSKRVKTIEGILILSFCFTVGLLVIAGISYVIFLLK
jgi:hypothetical protein